MASCSRWRGASAPADTPRWAELPDAALWWAAWVAVPPLWRSWIAATSWLLRIRAVPVMPMDCAIRCNSGSSMPDNPRPAPPAAPLVTASAGGCGPDVCGPLAEAPGVTGEPVKSSVVSLLTRGPSQRAGAGHRSDRATRCRGPANWPGQNYSPAVFAAPPPWPAILQAAHPASAVKAEGSLHTRVAGTAHPGLRPVPGASSRLQRWRTRSGGSDPGS